MSMPAYATYWYEYSPKAYIDLDSLQKSNNMAFAWVKLLNDGNIDSIDNKKIWFTQNTMYIDLKNKKTAIKDAYFYDLKGNQVKSYSLEKIQWDVIVPDSMGQYLYEIVKKYPRFEKVTEEELWVDIDEQTKLDVYSLLMTNSKYCNMWLKVYKKKPKKPEVKCRYIKAFLSVNIVDNTLAVIETIEYNKKGSVVKSTKFDNLNYIRDEEYLTKPIIDYIYKLSNMLDKPST
jgi:hypothetical protein